MKNLNIHTLLKDAESFSLSEDDSYILSYKEFISYFAAIEQIEEHHLVIGSHFVYGWMPTIIHLNLGQKDEVLALLNAAKKERQLNVAELELLKRCINNSLVGLSKLLHFINPTDYAIWDSRIYRYITEKKSSYGIDKPELYLEYLEGVKKIAAHEDYAQLREIITKHIKYDNYDILPTRVIELTMFETDRRRSEEAKEGNG